MAGSTPTDCPDLRVQAAQERLVLSNPTSTAIDTVVNVTCAVKGSSLDGESQLTCLASGAWSSALPTCSEGGELSDREIVIIASSCAVVFVVLLVLIIVVILYYRTKARSRQQRNDRLTATLERLSIRDPLDELVRRESRRSSYGNPAFTSSSGDDNDTEKRKLYKIWDFSRTRKQFVFAENLDELIVKGGEKLGLSGPIRVVLEEDGTEVDNDAVLRACAGMVLLLLEQNQVWTKPEVLLSVHEYSNNLNHYRYDIDEKL